jgi:amino acid transporter
MAELNVAQEDRHLRRSAAMIQYASRYVPGIYSGSSLTGLGVLLGIGVIAVFVVINWFGVLLFARINGALTVATFVCPRSP